MTANTSEAGPGTRPFLYVVVCASGIAGGVGELITAAQRQGWDVGVVATPQGLGFIDAKAIEAQTGYPIRSAWRRPGDPRPLPDPDAIAVAPATFNTINKWAAGISDTLALGILCEAHGLRVPTAALPCVNAAQAAHPAYRQSLTRLREMNVRIGTYEPHVTTPGVFNWTEALDLLTPKAPDTDTYTYTWRGEFENKALNDLHAEGFGHPAEFTDWRTQLTRHSLGWVCARRHDTLVGFVNVAWDGGSHAFVLDTVVSTVARSQGIGAALIKAAAEGARAAGCEWLHVDFEEHLRPFYFEACGFRPTEAGLIAL